MSACLKVPFGGPRIVARIGSAVVIDNFLPVAAFAALRDHVQSLDYKRINSEGVMGRAWHIQDGMPFRSVDLLWYDRWGQRFGSLFDEVFQAFEGLYSELVPSVGEFGRDWLRWSVNAWIYQVGTGLAMHADGAGVYSGAFAYYLNDVWAPHWGGLLVLADTRVEPLIPINEPGADVQGLYRRQWLHADGRDEAVMEIGLGQVIFPKPNRAVFMGPTVEHMVTPVLPSAGDRHRLSLAGFFHRQAGTVGGY
jgi:Rps23 Pro-64 3,4-dihydroxylase Tpa1-like proline 4-hydroxylase